MVRVLGSWSFLDDSWSRLKILQTLMHKFEKFHNGDFLTTEKSTTISHLISTETCLKSNEIKYEIDLYEIIRRWLVFFPHFLTEKDCHIWRLHLGNWTLSEIYNWKSYSRAGRSSKWFQHIEEKQRFTREVSRFDKRFSHSASFDHMVETSSKHSLDCFYFC